MEMRSEGPIKTRREGAILEVTLDSAEGQCDQPENQPGDGAGVPRFPR